MGSVFANRSFNAGELSPEMQSRADNVKYQHGLSLCRNMFTSTEGSCYNRPGDKFICPLPYFEDTDVIFMNYIINDDVQYLVIMCQTYPGDTLRFLFIKDGSPIFDATKTITGVTTGSVTTVTSVAHGLSDGDLVYLTGIGGIPQLNNRWVLINNAAADTFEVQEYGLADIDSSGFGTYTSGGQAQRLYTTSFSTVLPSDIKSMRWKQINNTLYVANHNYYNFKIERVSDTSWTIAHVQYKPTQEPPRDGTLTGAAGSSTVRYKVTAILDGGEETYGGPFYYENNGTINRTSGNPYQIVFSNNHGLATGDEIRVMDSAFVTQGTYAVTYIDATTVSLNGTSAPSTGTETGKTILKSYLTRPSLTEPSAANPTTLTWTAVTGAINYNIYREINGVYGYVGTSGSLSFIDRGYTISVADTPPILGPDYLWNFERRYSLAVGSYQQRLVLGATTVYDITNNTYQASRIEVSKSGLPENLTQSYPLKTDDAFDFRITGTGNEIRHFLDLGKLLVFTQGSVFSLEGDDAGTLKPTAINARLRADEDIGDVPPLAVNDVAVFVSNSGRVVRELSPDSYDRYRANDIAIYARHFFEFTSIVSWAWAKEPWSCIFSVMDDGTGLGCTYNRQQEVVGWHKHYTGSSQATATDTWENCISIQENDESVIYKAVRRYRGASSYHTFIERMSSRRNISTADDARHLDSYLVYDGRSSTNGWGDATLAYIAGPGKWRITISGSSPFTTASVGNAIHIYKTASLLLDGPIKCTITEYISSSQAYVTVIGFTDQAQSVVAESGQWDYAVNKVYGMDHLEGGTVYAVGDNQAIGPLSVVGNTVDLEDNYGRVTVGIRIESTMRTLTPESLQAETLATRKKTVSECMISVIKSSGFTVSFNGAEQAYNPRWALDDRTTSDALFTGYMRVPAAGKPSMFGYVSISQSSGLPLTVTGIFPTISLGA